MCNFDTTGTRDLVGNLVKFCCVASRDGEKRSYIYIYVWNIFGNLVVIFFYLGNFFFLRFNSGRKSFVRGKILSRVKLGMKR